MSTDVIDVEPTPTDQPASDHKSNALVPTQTPHVTPAQAKIDAVANLTMKAYERASMLEMTEEEKKKLLADFPDEAFRSGAGGKSELIYIEHAYLRDRLHEVFGPGGWALVPRARWGEDFTTSKGVPGVRIYVEAMLLVRGCFVAEAIGDMSYYPKNPDSNYGDVVEGAKSGALRRCAKELGIGLQAWKKSFCEGWWQRRGGKKPAPQQPGGEPTNGVSPAAELDEQAKANLAKWDKSIKNAPDVKAINKLWVQAMSFADSAFKAALVGLFDAFAEANPHLVKKDPANNCWVIVPPEAA